MNNKIKQYHRNNQMIYQTQQEASAINFASQLQFIGKEPIQSISCIEVYENQLYLATNERISIYKLVKGHHQLELIQSRSFYPHCATIHSIVASPAFLIVAPLKEQQLIRIWNRQKLYIVHGYKGHSKQISCLIVLRDGRHIASVSHDGTARVWSIQEPIQRQSQISKYTNKYPLLSLAQIDHDSIAFGGDDCDIIIWNWQSKLVLAKCFAHVGSIIYLAICDRMIYSMGGDSIIKLWRFNKNMIEGQIVEDDIHQQFQLSPLKQVEKTFSQITFKIEISQKMILAIDSKGRTFVINRSQEIIQKRVKLQYTDQILNVKLWKNILLMVILRKGSGKLSTIHIDLQDRTQGIVELQTKSIEVSAGTKHSLFVQSHQNIEILDL